MISCTHARIEACDRHQDDMHCTGWVCEDCGREGLGECHHRSWCRPDFCGVEPLRDEALAVGTTGG